MKKFPGDSGYSELGSDDSGGNVTVGAGNYSPNQNPTLNIPSSADEGDKYCEYIYFTNAAGAGTGAGQTSPVCVTVHHGGHGQTQGTCTKLEASVTGNYFNQSKRAHVVISGTNHDVDENIPDDGGAGKNYTGTYTKKYSYQPLHNSITVTVTTQYYTNGSNPHWQTLNTQVIRDPSQLCFSATCNITSVTGDVQPGGLVAAGGTMYVTGTYTNTSPAPDYLTLWNPVLQYAGDNQDYPAGGIVTKALGGGGSYGFSFPIHNTDTTPSVDNLSFTPVYFNNEAIGPPCTFNNVWSFQQFSASAVPYTKLAPTRENADHVQCYAYLDIGGTSHTVNLSTHSVFQKNGGDVVPEVYGGTYGQGRTYTIGGSAPNGVNCANTASNGYDQFCTNITLNYTGGWVGPDSNVYNGTGGRSGPPSCDNEYNEPYFKVMGAGAAADLGAVEKPDASGTLTCSQETNSGLLAGWNNNSDLAGVNRGAGSQLSALALLKITGFASAQTTFSTTSGVAGSRLSFANGGKDAAGATITPTSLAESPALGGSYGSQARCVKPPQPDASVAKTPSPGSLDLHTVDGQAKSYRGNLTLSNSAASLGGNTSVFVDGNVYISSPLQLNSTGWAIKNDGTTTGPSFTLTATGNIYIAPSVTQLDGLYVSSGTIYTCGQPGYTPMPASQLYDGCHDQLVFNGSVMANQVKMMRTFGSLRDEKAVTGTRTVTVSNNDGSVPFNRYYCGSGNPPGSVPFPSTHFYQKQGGPVPGNCLSGPSGNGPEGPVGYVLPGQTNGSVPLWYVNGTNGNDWLYTTSWAEAAQDGGRPCPGGCNPQVAGYVFNYPATGTVPLYGVFAFGGSTHFYTTSYSEYVNVYNTIGGASGGMALGAIAWIYPSPGQGGTTRTITVPTPLEPNLTPVCSHAGAQILRYTCAAEVIHFSPELYLGNQKIDEDSRGAVQYDAITSLPPVL
jgi:hypothetical protein